jgi:hypothetical protein
VGAILSKADRTRLAKCLELMVGTDQVGECIRHAADGIQLAGKNTSNNPATLPYLGGWMTSHGLLGA